MAIYVRNWDEEEANILEFEKVFWEGFGPRGEGVGGGEGMVTKAAL